MRRSTCPIILLMLALSGAAAPLHGQLVRGQVIDSITGTPIRESVVILEGPDGTEADRTVSDLRGFFLLRAPAPASYRLIAMREGYRLSAFPPFELEFGKMLSFVLLIPSLESVREFPDRGSQELAAEFCATDVAEGLPVIVGTVTDAVTGEPVAGAQVHLSVPPVRSPTADSLPGRVMGQRSMVETDNEGRYAVCGAPILSRISLHATEGDRMGSFEVVLFGTRGVFSGGAFHQLTRAIWRQDLELFSSDQRASTLTGSVTDTSGNALAGATVEIVGTPYQTRTDASGRFEFANLTQGDVRIGANHVGYFPVEYDLDLPPGQSVHIPNEMLALGQFPARLRDLIVVGEAARYGPRLAGFFYRRATNRQGKYVLHDEWQTWIHFNMNDIFDRLRYLRDRSRTCGVKTTSYYVDGHYISSGMPLSAFADSDVLAAIEAYGNGFDAPVRYRREGCGPVVLLWTSPR